MKRSLSANRHATISLVVVAVLLSVGVVLLTSDRLAPSLSVTDSPYLQTSGTELYLHGAPYRFVGVNAYEIATDWGTNSGCGADLSPSELGHLFSSLPRNSLVRFWAFQATMAINVHTHLIDWTPLDRVFASAAFHHQRLVVTIGDQGGVCDGSHWQDPSWYEGGFKSVFNSPSTTDGKGLTPLSYWTYLEDIVSRYANSPAVGMWEPISEAESSVCPAQFEPTACSGHQVCVNETSAASALRHFFDIVGTEIHTLDPKHPVESGLLGGGQCGTQGLDYAYVSASPGIDVLSYHDYYGSNPLGGDRWNGLSVRLRQSRVLGKPIIAGEIGLKAALSASCQSPRDRNTELKRILSVQIEDGASGGLLWNWVPTRLSGCSYDIGPTDPAMGTAGVVGSTLLRGLDVS